MPRPSEPVIPAISRVAKGMKTNDIACAFASGSTDMQSTPVACPEVIDAWCLSVRCSWTGECSGHWPERSEPGRFHVWVRNLRKARRHRTKPAQSPIIRPHMISRCHRNSDCRGQTFPGVCPADTGFVAPFSHGPSWASRLSTQITSPGHNQNVSAQS